MKIKTKLLLIVSIVVILSLTIIVVRYMTNDQINRTNTVSQKSEAIVREVFGQNNLLNDYLLNHTERAESQWLLQQKHIGTVLASQQYTNPDNEAIQRKIIEAHRSNGIIFPKLTQAYRDGMPKDLQDRLASQLLIKSQSMVENSENLSSRLSTQTDSFRSNARYIINILLAILVGSLVILLFLFYKSINDQIGKLHEGSRHVASGNWNYKVPVTSQDELGQLAEAFNNMTAKVSAYIKQQQQMEKQKDYFIASASHELKTPVTSIKLYSQAMQQRFLRNGDMSSVEQFDKINRQLTKLSSLINDLLDINKIETGKLRYNMESFDINLLIDEVVQEMQQITDGISITHNLVKRKKIYGDRNRIGQVLVNLISNAIKYSPQGQRIIITTKMHKNHCHINVQDFGIGIAEKDQKKIFGRFFRVNGISEQTYPGLGLGLYISKQIIKRHKGKIWLKSQKGMGSTFSFSLPIS